MHTKNEWIKKHYGEKKDEIAEMVKQGGKTFEHLYDEFRSAQMA